MSPVEDGHEDEQDKLCKTKDTRNVSAHTHTDTRAHIWQAHTYTHGRGGRTLEEAHTHTERERRRGSLAGKDLDLNKYQMSSAGR